jgi:hypothetical protein
MRVFINILAGLGAFVVTAMIVLASAWIVSMRAHH